MKKTALLAIILMLALMVSACGETQAETTPAAPENASEQEETVGAQDTQESQGEEDDHPEDEDRGYWEVYYRFFSDLEVIEYMSMHGPGSLWGHSVQGELRLPKQVYFNQIEGFDYPVLILAEFYLEEDGVTIIEGFIHSAYLIRNNQLSSDLDQAEFDAIFSRGSDASGWPSFARWGDQFIEISTIHGENLFFLDFSIGAQTAELDTVLDWIRENGNF